MGSASNCFAVSGAFTERGKPYLACDPHLMKQVNSFFYLTRVTWNETRSGEVADGVDAEYKTYLIGGTALGVPQFLYARTPQVAWGVTALYPDNMDLFVEEIDEQAGTYFDALTGKHEPFKTIEETINVRFGFAVRVTHRVTRNGVLVADDFLKGSAAQLMPMIPPESLKTLGSGKAFSIAWVQDPLVLERMGASTDLGQTRISQ